MNNILGQPVEGIDFFDREKDTQRIWSSLEEGNHVLLLAPRRVGKTSLAIRLGAEAIRSEWKFALVDVQRDRDELGFLDNLFQNLKSAGVKVPILARLAEWITYARRNLSGKTGIGDFSVEIDPGDGQKNRLWSIRSSGSSTKSRNREKRFSSQWTNSLYCWKPLRRAAEISRGYVHS